MAGKFGHVTSYMYFLAIKIPHHLIGIKKSASATIFSHPINKIVNQNKDNELSFYTYFIFYTFILKIYVLQINTTT